MLVALAHVYNASKAQPTFYRSILAITKGRFEGSVKSGRDGSHFPKLDFIDISAAYRLSDADVAATMSLNPQKLCRDTTGLVFGFRKNFAQNLTVKAKYDFFNSLSTFYTNFAASKNLSVSYSLQVASGAKEGVYQGFWNYPLNFGVQVNVNA